MIVTIVAQPTHPRLLRPRPSLCTTAAHIQPLPMFLVYCFFKVVVTQYGASLGALFSYFKQVVTLYIGVARRPIHSFISAMSIASLVAWSSPVACRATAVPPAAVPADPIRMLAKGRRQQCPAMGPSAGPLQAGTGSSLPARTERQQHRHIGPTVGRPAGRPAGRPQKRLPPQHDPCRRDRIQPLFPRARCRSS